jgi:hypothetical protein
MERNHSGSRPCPSATPVKPPHAAPPNVANVAYALAAPRASGIMPDQYRGAVTPGTNKEEAGMSFDATMKFSTNMSRQEIEAKIPELKKFAEAAGLAEIVKLLTDTAAVKPADLIARMKRCLELTGGKDEYALLYDQLDMLVLNLENLK